MKNIKTIIYDFDGTLGDTFKLHLEAYRFSLSKFDIEATNTQIIEKCFNKTNKIVAENFGISNSGLFSEYYHNALFNGFHNIELYPNVIKTLENLKKSGYKIGIGTMRNKKEMELIFKTTPIENYFDELVTSEQVSSENPKFKIYKKLCEKLNCEYKETIIVGDSISDLLAAKDLCIISILFYPESHKDYYELEELKTAEPTYIIKNHREILSLMGLKD